MQQVDLEMDGKVYGNGANFLKTFIKDLLYPDEKLEVSYMVPCDSTDTWIVAALDEYEDYESIQSPWNSVIAKMPVYHGIKIKNRPHKNKITYNQLISEVCGNWNTVIERCPQAKQFDEDVRHFLLGNQ